MRIKVTLLALGMLAGISAYSAPLTPEQALSRAMGDRTMKARSAGTTTNLTLAHTAKLEGGMPVAYVFTPRDGAGFTIASASDVAVPVLGYSDTSGFDADNMPVQMKWWLTEYGRRIKNLEERGVSADAGVYAPSEWSSIAPLCKTIWDQGDPYDRMTPEIKGKQTPTGCVATSFAQAMNYFKYPQRGEGVISYSWNGKSLRLNLGLKEIKWDLMLDNYVKGQYTDEQADAVAYLMKACGYSVQMNYGEYQSGALSYRLINALVNNFGYDPGVTYEDRNLYSSTEWASIIYNNLKNVGPIIYDGTAIDGGHSFICDGYDGNGYFHFNWGWGGMSDGYYALDVLNPESQGTGGATGGFNWDQNAVIGMQKPTGVSAEPRYLRMMQYGNSVGELNGRMIDWKVNESTQLGWGIGDYSADNGNVEVGAIVENLSDGSKVIAEGGMGTLGNTAYLAAGYWLPLTNTHPVIELPGGLADGQYRVTLATRDTNSEYENAPWQPVLINYGYNNCVLLNVENGVYKIVNLSIMSLDFKSLSFVNDLYYNKTTMMKGIIENNTNLDLTECVQPLLVSNGKTQFEGDMMLVSVDANTTSEQEWIVLFHMTPNADQFSSGTAYTLQLIDKNNGRVIGNYGEVTMGSVGGTLKIEVNEMSVTGAPQQNVTVGDRTFKNTYMIGQQDNIEICFDYEVTSGYFDGALTIGMQWYNPEAAAYERIPGDLYSKHPFLASGQGEVVKVNIDPMNLSHHTGVYNVVASSVTGGRNTRLGSITFAFDQTGVDDIMDESNAEVKYYNLQGVPVENPVKGDVLIVKTGGTVRKIVF